MLGREVQAGRVQGAGHTARHCCLAGPKAGGVAAVEVVCEEATHILGLDGSFSSKLLARGVVALLLLVQVLSRSPGAGCHKDSVLGIYHGWLYDLMAQVAGSQGGGQRYLHALKTQVHFNRIN